MDFLVGGIGYVVDLCGVDTSFVGALPTALMKSLSGSGANGLMIDTMKEMGPDSFVGRMSCVVRGASDTTFYILAVYFGSVGISKTRNAVTCGLIADFSGIIAVSYTHLDVYKRQPWMFTIPHQPCNRIEEDQTQQQKQERYAPYHQ